METYKLVAKYSQNLNFWLNSLPIEKDEQIEIIVISSKEKEKKHAFTDKDIAELCTINLTKNPIKFQKKIRNE